MAKPDFERAKQYALDRLEHDLPETAIYHSIYHTRDDVVPAVGQLAALAGVNEDDLLCLVTAAYFHDLGHIERRDGHEAISARLAAGVLPEFGYSPGQVELICALILVTKIPQHPQTLLERIIVDADLDSLGREDFLLTSQKLRAELVASGLVVDDEEWFTRQLEFLQSHQYFTEVARQIRGAGKQRNITLMQRLLAETKASNRS